MSELPKPARIDGHNIILDSRRLGPVTLRCAAEFLSRPESGTYLETAALLLELSSAVSAIRDSQYLLAHGWECVMTAEEGCETWRFPFEKRIEWPSWAQQKHGTQHFWDRAEAIYLESQIKVRTPE